MTETELLLKILEVQRDQLEVQVLISETLRFALLLSVLGFGYSALRGKR